MVQLAVLLLFLVEFKNNFVSNVGHGVLGIITPRPSLSKMVPFTLYHFQMKTVRNHAVLAFCLHENVFVTGIK